MAKRICIKCKMAMEEATNFYTYKNGEKVEMCKKCLTMHIDNFDPNTFLWLLEKMDVPYLENEWNSIRDKAFAKDPKKMTSMSVFGKYLSKMKLKQFLDPETGQSYGWADTEKLKGILAARNAATPLTPEEIEARDAAAEDLKRQLESGLITEAEYKTLAPVEVQNQEYEDSRHAAMAIASMNPVGTEVVGADNFYNEANYMPESELIDLGADLTNDDKLFLAMKWGRLYKPSEWVELERKYKEMKESFDIQDADSESTLILICKTDLKLNQAIDIGDVESYQKLSRVYDALRKSAKFTAAQNKEEKSQNFDAVGSIVAFCEKEGGAIGRYQIQAPLDKADEAIADIKKYLKNLIYNDTNLAQQIENYLKQLTLSLANKEDREKAKEQGLDYVPITDEDINDYNQHLYEQQLQDAQLLGGEEEE